MNAKPLLGLVEPATMALLLFLEADQRMFEARASAEIRLILRARRAAFWPNGTLI